MLKRMCYPGLALFCGIFCLRGWVPLPLLLQIHSVHSPRTSHYIRSWELDQALLWQKWLLLVFGRGGGLLQQRQLQLAKHAFGCSQVELSYLQAGGLIQYEPTTYVTSHAPMQLHSSALHASDQLDQLLFWSKTARLTDLRKASHSLF